MMIEKKNIAIVGANSILGQAIYDRLFKNYNVYQVYHLNLDNITNKENLIQIDEFLKIKNSYDIIYFISSVISFEEDSITLQRIFQTNVHLLKIISDSFKNSKLIHASSVAVYQTSTDIINEISPILPKSNYANSKLWAEHIVNKHLGGGVNIRISSLIGVQMKNNTFLPIIMNEAIKNKQVTIYGNGCRKQNYISAKEASEYFYKAISFTGDSPLLAVGNQSYSNLEVAKMIVEVIPNVSIVFLGEDISNSFFYNNQSTKCALSISQEYSFKESIISILQWMQKQY